MKLETTRKRFIREMKKRSLECLVPGLPRTGDDYETEQDDDQADDDTQEEPHDGDNDS